MRVNIMRCRSTMYFKNSRLIYFQTSLDPKTRIERMQDVVTSKKHAMILKHYQLGDHITSDLESTKFHGTFSENVLIFAAGGLTDIY